MFWLKACPKCQGDMCDEQDSFGYYVFCVGCGYYLNETQTARLERPMAKVSA